MANYKVTIKVEPVEVMVEADSKQEAIEQIESAVECGEVPDGEFTFEAEEMEK